MVSIDVMPAMSSGFTVPYPLRQNKPHREYVGRSERVKDAISMSVKYRSRQRVKSFINELGQGTVSPTDEEFARLKCMIVERRGYDTMHVTVAPTDTARPCSSRSRSSETSFDARLYGEK